ncbi:unnamed protein product [Cuscuta campestris]|uniref:Smr domain-containing protein n=1 Tax=Cuscuta campestris TaxID=132261 RepID=A0A484M157_9ASTE|nr:unnamed protein product [Cuscuta campestris]
MAYYPESTLFCNSLHSRSPSILSLRILKPNSVQIQVQASKAPSNSRQNISSSSTSYVWVNPNNPRASKLIESSYGSQYSSLLDISKSLDSCKAVEEDVAAVLAVLRGEVKEHDAVVILNRMSNPDTGLLVFDYFRRRLKSAKQVVLYNVTLNLLKKNNDFARAEELFDEMLERGVRPDKITLTTIIGCAKSCAMPKKALELFGKVPALGCELDCITCSMMIDCYARLGNANKALELYDRAREKKLSLDARAFSSLIRLYGISGNYEGCLNMYEEMKGLGVEPILSVYNNLLLAMGRAMRPWKVKNIYLDMVQNGFQPNWGTYSAMIQAYCRARYGDDSLNVYKEMKEKGMKSNTILYNTMLAMCADLGLLKEAIEIYNDMMGCETSKPDLRTYSSLVAVYSNSGKVSEAESILDEMKKQGLEPDIHVLTSLVRCYGKANCTDDVVRTFDWLLDLGLTPDERFCCCLVSVLAQTRREEMARLAACIEKGMPNLGYIVKLLIDEERAGGTLLKDEASEFFSSISTGVRRAFCNSLIDVCVGLSQHRKASELFVLGIKFDIYTGIQTKEPTQWCLHLKSMSSGAALTALHIWMNELSRAIENGDELPSLFGINTGHGRHNHPETRLANVLELHLRKLNAPFLEEPDVPGLFYTTNIAVTSWLKYRQSEDVIATRELVLN